MYHPLLEDPSKIKDQDLENRIIELSRKYVIAANMGQGGVCQQILAALDMYKDERQRRYRESNKTFTKNQDNGFDDLINVD